MRVRISSDAAGSISLTPVVVRDLTREELMEHIVSVCGKDPARIHEVVSRGTLVSGGSRLRWDGFELQPPELTLMLSRFPDPDPGRVFSADRCGLAVLRGGAHQIAVPREAAARRRLFRRRSFWDHLLALGARAAYVDYSYREKADIYRSHISPADQLKLQEASRLLTYTALTRQLEGIPLESVDLYVSR
ncbi:MAG TPA: hypothetical protein VFL57_17730 [Bryobacteraceae bacterium]|nr:hypothetical protein [Bryobacteraceae bacterium]